MTDSASKKVTAIIDIIAVMIVLIAFVTGNYYWLIPAVVLGFGGFIPIMLTVDNPKD